MDTIAEGVFRSGPYCYYLVKDNTITETSKNLTPLENLNSDYSALEKYMKRVVKATSESTGAVITGGFDSRSVLFHLIAHNVHPLLLFTGTEERDDVIIARKIAKALDTEINVLPDTPDGETWLEEASAAADGIMGTCAIYRLYRKAKYLNSKGIQVEFGGVAGEFYKNSFINCRFTI